MCEFHDTATPEIYTLSLHDALPIPISKGGIPSRLASEMAPRTRYSAPMVSNTNPPASMAICNSMKNTPEDRKSTRLNSSHLGISYAVFCLEHKSELQSLRHLVCRLLLEEHI